MRATFSIQIHSPEDLGEVEAFFALSRQRDLGGRGVVLATWTSRRRNKVHKIKDAKETVLIFSPKK